MSGNPSTDTAALRREARRKRILENSEKRLRSITGRTVEDKPDKSDTCFVHDDFQNNIFGETDREVSVGGNSAKEVPSFGTPLNYIVGQEVETKKQKQTENSWLDSLLRKRFHFIILPVIVQLLYISKLGFLFYNNLFCPFITVKLMEFILLQKPVQTEKQSLLSLLASKSQGSSIIHIFKAYSIVLTFISDFFLYIFIIVASDKLHKVVIGGS